MDGSPSSVISLGFGSWGSSGLTLTLGFGVGGVSATIVGVWSQVIHAFSDQPRIAIHSTTLTGRTADGNERIEVDG